MRSRTVALGLSMALVACGSGASGGPNGANVSTLADAASEGGDDAAVRPGVDGGGTPEASAPVEGGATLDAAGACPSPGAGGTVNAVKYVFVIAMENHDSGEIIGNVTDAPYINQTLLRCYASSANFNDPLPIAIPSEPHYVWMEAGTNAPAGTTFTNDADPSATNSTSSTLHLSTQLDAASVTWRSYQEGLVANATGACPIHSSGDYAAKHDPFVFFQDVAGSPPASDNAYCSSHHKALTSLGTDLTGSTVAQYDFITPDLCHDMHGAGDCPNANAVQAGDQFLQVTLPALISFAFANDGVVFIVWDEGDKGSKIPFIAIGPGVKRGYVGTVAYTHSSLLATTESIFRVPRLATVTPATDLADLFQAGALP